MHPTLRKMAISLLPPFVTETIRAWRARRREAEHGTLRAIAAAEPVIDFAPATVEPQTEEPPAPPEWEVVADTDELWASLGGWDHRSVAETQIAKWPDFLETVRGNGILGQSHESAIASLDLATHNTIVSFGYALARACGGRREISVLDWGGGLGHYYHYAKALLPGVSLDYTVKDVPTLCEEGRKLLPEVTFASDDDVLARTYDFVFASSAVHYERDPYAALGRLAAASREWLFVTRTPIMERSGDLLVVQRPYAYGYMTEYAGWMMNRQRFVHCLDQAGFALERQFLIGEQPYLPMLDEAPQYFGFLFHRK